MSPKQIAERTLASFVSKGIEKEGFRFEKDQSMYVREVEGKTDMFSLIVTVFGKTVYVTNMAAVGIHAIEEILREQKEIYVIPPKHTFSVAMDIWRKYPDRKYELNADRDDQFKELAAFVLRDFKEIALPFFDRFRTLSDVDTALNSEPAAPCPDRANVQFRCFVGVIASKISGRPNHKAIVETYEKTLTNWAQGGHLGAYHALVSHLEHT